MMFRETGFENEEDWGNDSSSTGTSSGLPTPKRGSHPAPRAKAPSEQTVTMHFHRPGEVGFCSVAGAGDDSAASLDARTISGDTWVSDECRCARCECLRVMHKLAAAEAAAKRKAKGKSWPIVLLVLDLDNFGFNQFKSVPPGTASAMDSDSDYLDEALTGVNTVQHLFMWSFFGSCFTRYHHTWPTEESVSEPLATSAASGSRSSPPPPPPPVPLHAHKARPSIWQRVCREGRVHFTHCSGQSQAADHVMMSVLAAFADRDVIVLSGDSKLLQEIQASRRRVGNKSRRDNESAKVPDHLTLIDVNDDGKRFVPVWKALDHRVKEIVSQCRQRAAADAKKVTN